MGVESRVKRKLAVGSGLVLGSIGIGRGIEAGALALGASGYLDPLVSTHPNFWLAGVFTVSVGVGAWGSKVNLDMLRRNEIGVSPNLPANFLYHIPVLNGLSKMRDVITVTAPNFITADYFRIAGALQSEQLLAGFVASKIISSAVGVLKNTGILTALKIMNRENKPPVPEKGVIFTGEQS